MEPASLVAAYDRYFETRLARDDNLLEQVFHIRYQVYCEEFGYEEESRFPDRMERDEYDQSALHCLMTHRTTGASVGCLRFIQADGDHQMQQLPFERVGPIRHDADLDPKSLSRANFGELSRLAVLKSFRRRQHDEPSPISLTSSPPAAHQERRCDLPCISLGLIVAGISMFLRSRTDFTFAMMEPRLARLLRRFGIPFVQIGDLVEHHGPRAAFVLTRETATESMQPEIVELFRRVDRQLFVDRQPDAEIDTETWRGAVHGGQ